MSTPERYACASVVTSPSYVIGAMVLGQSLRRVGWNHDTLLLLAADVGQADRDRLSRFWRRIVEVQPIENPNPRQEQGMKHFGTVYTKLRCWEQTEYDKLVYLDADTIALHSLDDLLDCPTFGAAPCMGAFDKFNTGVMTLKPSAETFRDMVSKIDKLSSYDGSDQGFLNSYYPDWFNGTAQQRLPMRYNVPYLMYLYRASWNRLRHDMRVLHFVGPLKPWKLRTRFGRGLQKRIIATLFRGAYTADPSPYEMWWDVHKELNGS